MTMSADQARSSLAARAAERDLIRTNLQALYDNVGMKLLTGASLTGTSKQAWGDASGELAAMLETFTAYSEILDRASAILGRGRRPAAAALAEVGTLLTGPSVRLTAAPTPLGRRRLTGGGHREVTLSAAVQQMTRAFAKVSDVVTQAETVWDEVTSRLDGIDNELGLARKQAAGLADDALTADVTAADQERAMADQRGGAEDPGLNAAYAEAERLLVTGQCRLTAAADAVTRYQQAVRKFLGRERGR